MIQITDKSKCCGCNACGDVCPKDAISFHADIEGFWYPEVDKDRCVDCGLCDKVCPVIHANELKNNELPQSECHAAIHKNIEVRFDSTSGGLFSALAERTYKEGGYVGGAIFNEDYSVSHFISNDKKDLAALRSSKYLQSNAEGFYKLVRQLLKKGEKVLVCGTPCQMAALRRFLVKSYDNLVIVDFICLGVNSPKVFRKYLDYLEDRYQSKIVYFKAKNKELGWRQLTSKVVFENKQVLYDTKDTSFFTIGYLKTKVYSRPSCYDCQFKGFPRMADITVADYWGAEHTVGKELDNDMGTSLVMLNSHKGKSYFETIKSSIIEKEIPFESILGGNRALVQSLGAPLVDRTGFYEDLDKMPFQEIAAKYIQRAIDTLTWRRRLKNVLRFLWNVTKVSRFNLLLYWKNVRYNFFCKQVKCDIMSGSFMLIHRNVILEIHPKARMDLKGIFSIGQKKFSNSKLETRVLVEDNAVLKIDNNFSLGYGSDVEVFQDALLHIEGNGATNINATIICGEHIHLCDRVMLGRDITIRDNNGNHYIAMRGYKDTRPVFIGQHAWLCEGATIMPGVKVGDGAIIGAKSFVAKNVPAYSMVSGNPAQVIEEEIYWKY